jgi:hypothetical protein
VVRPAFQPVAQRHQLIDLGDDAKLLAESRNGDQKVGAVRQVPRLDRWTRFNICGFKPFRARKMNSAVSDFLSTSAFMS